MMRCPMQESEWQHEMANFKISIGVECDFGSGVVFCLGCVHAPARHKIDFLSRNVRFGFLCYF